MAVNFLDTSALVKRYVNESGTQAVVDICNDAGATLVIADITRAELISALNRRARDDSISEDEHQLLKAAFAIHLIRDYLLAAVEPAHITAACELIEHHALRAYDAVQLAVAVAVRRKLLGASAEPFRFVSADADLTAAATAEGMSVVEP